MIGSARFRNFKALKDVEITFDSRLTVLVGPNGSGKSSVLTGVNWLCQMTRNTDNKQQLIKSLNNRSNSWIGGADGKWSIEFRDNNMVSNGIRLRFQPTSVVTDMAEKTPPRDAVVEWICIGGELENVGYDKYPESLLHAESRSSQLICLNSSVLAAPSSTKMTPPDFSERGEGLASLMAYFKLYDEPKFNQIEELFRSIIPQVRRIRIERVKTTGETLGEGLLFDLTGRMGVRASAMSDGTLYALGLIVKILDPQRPDVLLIDDVEHGFHPRAQLQLVELLRKLLDEIPDLQIIATTHSPFILDRLNWNEVRVTGLREDGSVAIAKIEDHPQIDRWKEDMTPGEFWTTFYENWVAEQQPTTLQSA
ncbi:AAA family ATPase [Zavarzinella formosa]|uniref:AAA family ATPase n=1 Tax=Zavarzinella formosa TaxID=360055 RepID=UPI0003182736|nr:ATP-binding protein [Zavarzinella formosa]